MLDTRREALRRMLRRLSFSLNYALSSVAGCVVAAGLIAFLPEYSGLSPAGRWMLFILITAAGLWISEAIPAFAVSILIVALEIAILGRPGGVFATNPTDWEIFIRPWASPLMWLFLAGLVMAEAATKTHVDRWLSGRLLQLFGTNPRLILLGVMAITFMFSMFMSNTAATAMMMTVITPFLAAGIHRQDDEVNMPDPDSAPPSSADQDHNNFIKGLLLGIPFAANIGGMATVIGTPPNAIAIGSLSAIYPMDFFKWMCIGLPLALGLFIIMWLFLIRRYRTSAAMKLPPIPVASPVESGPNWPRLTVMAVFAMTILLWMSEPLHGIPTTVISFIPITAFAVAGIITPREMRRLPWDILILILGGLALGTGVSVSGLDAWLVAKLPAAGLNPIILALIICYFVGILSNLMSNTAVANIAIPIFIGLMPGREPMVIIPIALAASTAMCLPISTPPNAIAYAQGRLTNRDFLAGGLLIGLIAPPLIVFWVKVMI